MAENETKNTDPIPATNVEKQAPIVVRSNSARSLPNFSTLAGFGLLGIVAYYLTSSGINKLDDKKQKKEEEKFSNELTSEVLKDNNGSSYNPKTLAAKYKQAIFGAGTSEQALMDLARISKAGRWNAISTAYKKLTNGALNNDIQAEFSTGEYTLFIKILQSKYWFAKGEYVYPQKETLIVYEDNKIKPDSFYWTYKTGQGIGTIQNAKRVKYKDKTIVVYLTNAYPGKWIWSQHLKTKYDSII